MLVVIGTFHWFSLLKHFSFKAMAVDEILQSPSFELNYSCCGEATSNHVFKTILIRMSLFGDRNFFTFHTGPIFNVEVPLVGN